MGNRLKPDYDDAYISLGNALRGLGKIDKAIEAYSRTVAVKPDYPEAICSLGTVLGMVGRFAEALEQLELGHELGTKRP